MSFDKQKQLKYSLFWILGIVGVFITFILVDKVIFSIQVLYTLEIHGDWGIYIILGTSVLVIIVLGAIINLIREFKPQFLAILPDKPRKYIRRVEIIAILIIFGTAISISGIGVSNSVKLAGYLDDKSKTPWILWSDDPTTSVRICWETDSAQDANLKWGIDANNLINSTKSFLNKVHLVDLTGLSPNTTYFYQVDGFSTIFNFTTAPSNTNQYRFIKVGDSQYNTAIVTDKYKGGGSPSVIASIKEKYFINGVPEFDFFISSGDQVDRAKDDHFKRYFADWEWAMSRGVPWIVAAGNHETYFDPHLRYHQTYFNYIGTRSMPGAPENYWTAYGNMLIINIFLSMSGAYLYDFEPRTGVLEWLDQVLENQSVKYEWVIINQHHPIYVSSWYPGEFNKLGYDPILVEKQMPLIEKYGVDLVLSGHWHSYERLTKANCTFVMQGAAGGGLDGWGTPQSSLTNSMNADSQAANYDSHSYTVFDVNGSQIKLTTWAVNGTVLDTTTIYSK
jgi:hypothetical protein